MNEKKVQKQRKQDLHDSCPPLASSSVLCYYLGTLKRTGGVARLTRLPVTEKFAGSNPVRSARTKNPNFTVRVFCSQTNLQNCWASETSADRTGSRTSKTKRLAPCASLFVALRRHRCLRCTRTFVFSVLYFCLLRCPISFFEMLFFFFCLMLNRRHVYRRCGNC